MFKDFDRNDWDAFSGCEYDAAKGEPCPVICYWEQENEEWAAIVDSTGIYFQCYVDTAPDGPFMEESFNSAFNTLDQRANVVAFVASIVKLIQGGAHGKPLLLGLGFTLL